MAVPELVSPAAATPTSSDQNSPVPTITGVPPGTPMSVSSCVVPVRCTFQHKGFSLDVALRIASAHHLSTQSVYDSKWRLFCDWSAEQARDPFSTTAHQLADFRTLLFKDKQFAPSTIASYQTTVINTLEEVTGACPAGDHLPSGLLSQFEVERPHPCHAVPSWDLALLLHALHCAPFKPLAQAPLWAPAFKTVFLVTLASAKCCSKLHTFSHRVQHPENWSSVTLLPNPLFMAKTKRACHPDTRLQEVTLRALAPFVDPDLSTDTNNCVVCAVKIYLSCTRASRCGQKCLFIYQPGHHDEIKAPMISSWLVKTVHYIYEHKQDQTACLFHVKGHDLCAFATSWNGLQKVSTRDILCAAQRRSHNTFTGFYLVDLSVIEEDTYNIGPLVIAHHITHP